MSVKLGLNAGNMEFDMQIENLISMCLISSAYFCLIYGLQNVKLKKEWGTR